VSICQRHKWKHQHLRALRTCYGRAPHFEETFKLYESLMSRSWQKLFDLNVALLRALVETLGVDTRMVLASDLEPLTEDRDGRLMELCRRLGADTYLAGQGGRGYMDLERFRSTGIDVVFQDYIHPSYPQLFGDFIPQLSVLDLLFNCGSDSLDIIRRGR